MYDSDAIIMGSGIGGLGSAALLSRYGKQVIVCESRGSGLLLLLLASCVLIH